MNRRILTGAMTVVAVASQWIYAEDWSLRARGVAQARLACPTARESGHSPDMPDDGISPDQARHLILADASDFRSSAPMELARLDEKLDPGTASETPATAPTATQPAEVERGPLPTFGETVKRDVHEMWHDLWHDTKAVYLNPWNVAFLVSAGGASLAVRPEVDDDFEDHYRRHHTFGKSFRNLLDAGGSPATGAIVAGTWYLAGQILQQDKTYEVGKRLASALIITDLSTVLLKAGAYTRAPNRMRFGWPSGHMSSTMALATVLNDAYGPVVGAPMFALTAFVGIERLDDREHHFSDVIFGTALGWLVAEQVMKEHRPEIFGGEIIPYIDPEGGNTGIAWLKTLGQ